ncbi:hypothetical protein DFA_00421 [Cavenderia fasciculata]|uniref:BTB domain-containing protein n=1 Tax=Cavenderia fasciculata TaxID=261658 RepID=F4PRR1_CACFS|nr:uncharacterized protein DFA_00421 [Cavenderia fasciculata]EGG20560.1 hypothetical protein DFA_00421 [Cavenderia fasciculata]|eukprot:XP_004358410.1 hypothetical protein DFA_00421 [Cavenderia fasciculata]
MSQTPVDIESYDSHPDQNAVAGMDDDTVVLNVGGVKYEVRPSTLCKYPNTLLGQYFSPNNKHMRKADKKGEYFFDRNGRVFEVILNFYRTGKLVIPTEIPQELLREELKYFKLDYDDGSESDSSKENEDEKILKLPRDQIYTFANNLIHSPSKYEVKRGLYFLQNNNSYLYKYSIAYAYYRLGMNRQGLETLDEILETDPHNPQAQSLLVLFNDSRTKNATIGLVAFGLIIIGVVGVWKLRGWWLRRAADALVTSGGATTTAATTIAPAAAVVTSVASPQMVQSATNHVASSVLLSAVQPVADAVSSSVTPAATAVFQSAVAQAVTPSTLTTSFVDSNFAEAMGKSLPEFRK